MRKLIVAGVCVSLLAGCATMQPKAIPVSHRHHAKVRVHVKVAPAPKPTPVVAPPKPKSFFQRHQIQWLHH